MNRKTTLTSYQEVRIREQKGSLTCSQLSLMLDLPKRTIYNFCDRYKIPLKKHEPPERILIAKAGKKYYHKPVFEDPKKKLVRPPAVYSNPDYLSENYSFTNGF